MEKWIEEARREIKENDNQQKRAYEVFERNVRDEIVKHANDIADEIYRNIARQLVASKEKEIQGYVEISSEIRSYLPDCCRSYKKEIEEKYRMWGVSINNYEYVAFCIPFFKKNKLLSGFGANYYTIISETFSLFWKTLIQKTSLEKISVELYIKRRNEYWKGLNQILHQILFKEASKITYSYQKAWHYIPMGSTGPYSNPKVDYSPCIKYCYIPHS